MILILLILLLIFAIGEALKKKHPTGAAIVFCALALLCLYGPTMLIVRYSNGMIDAQRHPEVFFLPCVELVLFVLSVYYMFTLPTTKNLREKQAKEPKETSHDSPAQSSHTKAGPNLYIDYSALANAVFSDTVDMGREVGGYEKSVMEVSRQLNYGALVLSRDKIAEIYKDPDTYKEQERLLVKAFAKSMGTPASLVRRVIRNYNDSKRYRDQFNKMLVSDSEIICRYANLVELEVTSAFKPVVEHDKKKSAPKRHNKVDSFQDLEWEEF